MKWHRIEAILIRHLYLYKRSIPRLMDIFYWPVMDILVWGFLSIYLDKLNIQNINLVTLLLGALIFWDFLNNSQRSISLAFLEDVWERNVINIFVTPLRVIEFVTATLFLGVVRILLVGVVASTLAFVFYKFNIFQFGFYLIPFLTNLLFFGWVLGLFVIGIILRYGSSAQILAFAFIFLIQPFSAVFYPVSALPEFVRIISYALPPTYVFEGMRQVVTTGSFPISQFAVGLALNFVYLLFSLWFFYKMFARAKSRGMLMKLESW